MNGKAGSGKPMAQLARQQVAQAAGDIAQGTRDEAKNIASAAAEQITGIGQSNPTLPNPNTAQNTEEYWQNEKIKQEQRIEEIRAAIRKMGIEEQEQARQTRQQVDQSWHQAQEEALKKDEIEKQEQEKKGGNILTKVKRRLGQIMGPGKGEKGKAAKG